MMRGSELISWLLKTSCFPILRSGPPQAETPAVPDYKQEHATHPISVHGPRELQKAKHSSALHKELNLKTDPLEHERGRLSLD